MSISDNYVPLRQIGNGVTTEFSSNWAVLAAAYIQVLLEDAVSGTQIQQVLGSDFNVTFDSSGFTVTFSVAPPSTDYVIIGRDVALDQTDPYRTVHGFQGEVVEDSFDKLTAITQDLSENITRSLQFPLGDPLSGVLPPISLRANKNLGFDSSGAPIMLPASGTMLPPLSYNRFVSTAYTVKNSDWGTVLEPLSAGGDITITLPTVPNSMPAGWYCYIWNGSFATNSRLFFNGSLAGYHHGEVTYTAWLGIGDVALISCAGDGGYILQGIWRYQERVRLTADLNLYVNGSIGMDFYNGLTPTVVSNASGIGPLQTLQGAINLVQQRFDLNGHNIIINCPDQAFTAGITVDGPWVGNGTVTLMGNTTTPANCTISVAGGNCITLRNGARLAIAGFKLGTTSSGDHIAISAGAMGTIAGKMEFNACAGAHLTVVDGGQLSISSSYSITAGGSAHYNLSAKGQIGATSAVTVTLSSTPAFSNATAYADFLSYLNVGLVTFSGSATGARYLSSNNSVINTNAGGSNFIPGNSGGTASTGRYV